MAMVHQIRQLIDEMRPCLQEVGGDIELLSVSESGEVAVRASGSCAGCPVSMMTLRSVIEQLLRQRVDDRLRVVTVA